jgi:hypothetical protein
MDSIIISSVDLSPLKSLSKYIQLDFEGYFEEEGSGYPFSLLLDTETNMSVKHPGTDTQSIKFAFTKDNLNINLWTTYEEKGVYYGGQISGTRDNEAWLYDDFNEEVENLNQNEIDLLSSVFTEENKYKIIHDVIDVTNNL